MFGLKHKCLEEVIVVITFHALMLRSDLEKNKIFMNLNAFTLLFVNTSH